MADALTSGLARIRGDYLNSFIVHLGQRGIPASVAIAPATARRATRSEVRDARRMNGRYGFTLCYFRYLGMNGEAFRASRQSVETIRGDNGPRVESLHLGHVAIRSSDADTLQRDGLIRLNDVNECAGIVSLDCVTRQEDHTVVRVDQQPYVYALVREERAILICERRSQLERALLFIWLFPPRLPRWRASSGPRDHGVTSSSCPPGGLADCATESSRRYSTLMVVGS